MYQDSLIDVRQFHKGTVELQPCHGTTVIATYFYWTKNSINVFNAFNNVVHIRTRIYFERYKRKKVDIKKTVNRVW
mgnify:CR=1 FL=1